MKALFAVVMILLTCLIIWLFWASLQPKATLPPPQPRKLQADTMDRSGALLLCYEALQQQVRFPSEIDLGVWGTQVGWLANNPTIIGVRGNVQLMNGLGLMIPHTYACDIDPKERRVIRTTVQPG